MTSKPGIGEAGEDGALGEPGGDVADDEQDDGAEHREGIGDDQPADLGEAGFERGEGVLRVEVHDGDPVCPGWKTLPATTGSSLYWQACRPIARFVLKLQRNSAYLSGVA